MDRGPDGVDAPLVELPGAHQGSFMLVSCRIALTAENLRLLRRHGQPRSAWDGATSVPLGLQCGCDRAKLLIPLMFSHSGHHVSQTMLSAQTRRRRPGGPRQFAAEGRPPAALRIQSIEPLPVELMLAPGELPALRALVEGTAR